jgi:hypothetical protein
MRYDLAMTKTDHAIRRLHSTRIMLDAIPAIARPESLDTDAYLDSLPSPSRAELAPFALLEIFATNR